MSQMLLIPDPRPLDERLGRQFFRQAPKRPGVYLMRDAAERVLYVGKAKDLQQRLRNYRIANPDRMPRRHLRMVRRVARIEFQFCHDESAALRRESKLLRSLKPRFNRAGVWPGKTRFFVWRQLGEQLELAVAETPEPGWQRFGPLGRAALHLRWAVARLLWLAVNPDRAFAGLPTGWANGGIAEKAVIQCGSAVEEFAQALDAFFWEMPDGFAPWLQSRLGARSHPFERAAVEGDLEILKEFAARLGKTDKNRRQLSLL
jgi:predicted GIY-YIG superfamily endonuclease